MTSRTTPQHLFPQVSRIDVRLYIGACSQWSFTGPGRSDSGGDSGRGQLPRLHLVELVVTGHVKFQWREGDLPGTTAGSDLAVSLERGDVKGSSFAFDIAPGGITRSFDSGKLTVTFPRNVGQIPIYYNYKNTGRPAKEDDRYTSKYIDSPLTPLIPFGHGLSYTTFEYSNLQLDKKQLSIPGSLTITADIKNTGRRLGEEVDQLYIRDLVGSVTRPVKELKGFEKISLAPGQTKKVSFVLTTDDLKFYDINMNFVVEPGDFHLWVGPGSAEGLKETFEIVD